MRRRWLKRLTTAAAFLTAGAAASVLVAWGLVVVRRADPVGRHAMRDWSDGQLERARARADLSVNSPFHDLRPDDEAMLDGHLALASRHQPRPPLPTECMYFTQDVFEYTVVGVERQWGVINVVRTRRSWVKTIETEVIRAGWPWASVEATLLALPPEAGANPPPYTDERWTGALPTPSWLLELTGHQRDATGQWNQSFSIRSTILPYRPLWPGFLANTAIYALALWLPFFGATAWRRARRRRRNRCPACGYSRAGLAAHAPCPECGGAATTSS